ncbi:Ankyrin repeat and SAM domain-containing protein 1A [Morella rubra]|uniref:Ankyrin repeat and SAM domain-containing protein 1A n=1 Tax=Morella rubra TaxID=262757 RepID=A0A6A1WB31_9ROSI|nr:Ankyrin repeat and SAM domain-containing protein 1A [Morella rubra]
MEKVAPNTPRTALEDLSLVVISQGTEIPHERERSDKYLHLRAPLYQAALKGDWQAAKVLLEIYPNAVRVPATKWKETALHIAAVARHLEFENIKGNTALCSAALSGALTIAEVLVKMNNKLLLIRSKSGKIPLHIAALYGRRSLVSYLFSVTPFEELAHGERVDLLIATINTDMYGFKEFYDKANLMRTFAHQLVEGLWKEILKLPERKFYELVDNHLNLIFEAAKLGNAEFLVILVRSTPDLVRALKKRGMT